MTVTAVIVKTNTSQTSVVLMVSWRFEILNVEQIVAEEKKKRRSWKYMAIAVLQGSGLFHRER